GNAGLAQDAAGEGAAPVAPARGGQVLTPDAAGVVTLPAGVTLDNVQVQGRDLVVIAAEGTRYIIPDGAIVVPQLVVDGAAGPPQSSGGNFAGDVGPLQDAFGLGDLLPYTELQFPEREEREILPNVVDRKPDISIEIDDSGVSLINAVDAVNEAGLPARGTEPAGSSSASNSESTYGHINFASPDGTSHVTINGVAITQVGQTFASDLGVLTITSIEAGRIGYTYLLTDNTTDPASRDGFTVTVVDVDGDTATATRRIHIIEDVPPPRNGSDALAPATFAPKTGNVITGAGTPSGAAGADTLGADDATLTGIHGGTTGTFAAPGTIAG